MRFLQQAHRHSHKSRIGGWYVSDKLVGVRCFWDGGLSRDRETLTVPFANKEDRTFKATGMWSSDGYVIPAPDWWLNQLPPMPLDGHLVCGNRQTCCKIVFGGVAFDWDKVEYAVYDSPSLEAVFRSRSINTRRFRRTVIREHADAWLRSLPDSRLAEYISLPPTARFEEAIAFLDTNLDSQGRVYLTGQRKLPPEQEQAQEVTASLRSVVIRNPDGVWEPCQTRNVLTLINEPIFAG